MTSQTTPRVLPDEPDANADDDIRSIVVAILTFRRPVELAALLDGFSRINAPPRCRVTLLVIDNDAAASARETIDRYHARLPNLRYVVEPRLGIPVARNRAVREALSRQADALCFIDDDEIPDRDWLVNLVEHWRRSGAHLVGGPVHVATPPSGATRWNRLINRSLEARAHRRNADTARAAAVSDRYTVVTNNWLCDGKWLAASGLRFNEQMLLTGGSDTAFCQAAVAAGCRKAWAENAIVRETITLDRLTLRYQFWRGASQSITHFRMKHARVTPAAAAMFVAVAAARAVPCILLMVIPIYGRASLTIAVRSLGWAAGRIQALCGYRSTLYAHVATAGDTGRPDAFGSERGRAA